ncbi:hypothetical protein [Streptomyces pseudovenezuelae]|uniref:Uncharacterized protein n=1 Tax=Streptomyces pseudovenezuelae TaxID=67350 RepID=A0ABZ1WP74_9ACTN|nr:hypothetical protein [Streptomyces pseudovenezuelae]
MARAVIDGDFPRAGLGSRRLVEPAPAGTLRVVTDGRTVIGFAAEVTAATGWVPARLS